MSGDGEWERTSVRARACVCVCESVCGSLFVYRYLVRNRQRERVNRSGGRKRRR